MSAAKIDLKNAPFSLVKAIALSLARDIDRGQHNLRDELERVLSYAPDAKVSAFELEKASS
jgi:hypothetical protein